jgi:hypothetical protein
MASSFPSCFGFLVCLQSFLRDSPYEYAKDRGMSAYKSNGVAALLVVVPRIYPHLPVELLTGTNTLGSVRHLEYMTG